MANRMLWNIAAFWELKHIVTWIIMAMGIIVGMGLASERRCYYVMASLIGNAHTQNDPCLTMMNNPFSTFN